KRAASFRVADVRRASQRSELGVEVLLELERSPALLRVARVERRLRSERLECLDDPRRVRDLASVDDENRHGLLAAQPQHRREVEPGQERPADVRDALPVERPARLLVVVREAKLPEDRASAYSCISAAARPCQGRWQLDGSAYRLGRDAELARGG